MTLESASKGSPGRRERMNNFISHNSDFANAFISRGDSLLNKYERLSSEDKKAVNMYYLALVHTINPYAYKKQSNFVSASKNIEVAEQFESSLMILAWMPKRSFQPFVASGRTTEFVTVCKSVGLPYAGTPVYPEQAEITVRYGLLPHFIIGVKINKDFYINPALFETMELFSQCRTLKQLRQLRQDVIMHGLKVNQDRFLHYCTLTNYRRYFTYDGTQYHLHMVE